jgi:hypothetical protein
VSPDRDGIDEGEGAVVATVEQVRAQGGGAAEVVGDDVGRVEAPVVEQCGEHPVLHAERHVLPRVLLGFAVAQQIPPVHAAVRREVRRDPPPDLRREGRAVQEHQRVARACDAPAHLLAIEREGLRQIHF